MIPQKIHYCWFGNSRMPEQVLDCIESWHRYMPDWEYRFWDESNFDVNSNDYCREAYEAKKYAFVSDYVRLYVLEREGGVYLDTDVEVFKSFDDLIPLKAFAGFEGSKYSPVGTCVMASEPHGQWVTEILTAYNGRHFIQEDGKLDLTTNVRFINANMAVNGFRQDGREQDYRDCHIFPVEYFCPRRTTGEYIKTNNTYCDHKGLGSWNDSEGSLKVKLLNLFGQSSRTRLIKIKRALIG